MDTKEIKSPRSLTSDQINRVIVAIIQIQDEKKAAQALSKLGAISIQLATTGGFLSRQNVMLLIGLSSELIEDALEIFQQTCHKRTEYVSAPLEGTPLPIPLSTPIVIGGATIFVFNIDQFEEIY
jgi:uncharacterized protein YaaQ